MRTARSVAQRVVGERAGAHHPQPPRLEVGAAAVRVEQLPAGERLGHGVDREVARGEVGADVAVRSGDEVDVPGVAPGRPRATRRTRPTAGRRRRRSRRATARAARLRVLRHGEVEVDRVAAEQPVAHRAADDPRLPPGERRRGRRRAAPFTGACSRGTRALIAHVIS